MKFSFFWISWTFATLLTGAVFGFYLSHSIVLGPFFTWMVESDRVDFLLKTYAPFRSEHPTTLYYIILAAQGIAATIFMIATWIKKRNKTLAVITFICAPTIGLIHGLTGFGELEVRVLLGKQIAADQLAAFVSMNVPIHGMYAAIMLIAFGALILVPVKTS